ncbi:protachykinin-like [Brachyistius frenatus]|uniref:protachykinin-like n=1 Tax=Brachyistius frenatus TaxID=100188 RepID=UPI0037E75FAC
MYYWLQARLKSKIIFMQTGLGEITHALQRWETVQLFLILVLLLSNVFCRQMEAENWREDIEENKWPNSEAIPDILVRMIRKPGPRQYLGLVGKKGSGKLQAAHKRHKFQTFVGLMGKRSSEDQGWAEDY